MVVLLHQRQKALEDHLLYLIFPLGLLDLLVVYLSGLSLVVVVLLIELQLVAVAMLLVRFVLIGSDELIGRMTNLLMQSITTGFDEVDRVLLVGVHLHDTADTLVLTRAYVEHIRTGIEVA